MLRLACLIDRLNDRLGAGLAWATLAIVLIQFAVVILRYAFGLGSVWMQEALTYLFASLFMLGSADALRRGAHVRVDIWYREAPARAKIWVDVIGVVGLLWPTMLVLGWQAWPYVAKSVAILEGSAETAGLPAVWLLKCEILAFVLLLALQGLAFVIRGVDALSRPAPAVEGT
ncbi:TRAP transporter small permease subunit [Prosthecodimorpha staleyi]|uniref:TRAP transporter small permease protein n=1 Tax=Prosthecodimorpha staleyi TaxID=2840188 RepID=A0A947D250_9HYPH|nr:TRAP transporter small permease subunit [Prosthecodimorpha staleyi]MBT9289306.1 TRAP transporter small permease subunit [Prosthecodimorpha staleyi]